MKKFEGFMHGVNLGGWYSQCNHSEERYNTFITEQDFKNIKGWGLDHIRLPIDYNLIEDEDGTPKQSGFDRIATAAQWCKNNHLNLILDLHKTAGFSFDAGEKESGFFDSPAYQERFYKLWEELTRRYAGYRDRVAFELLNEVVEETDCEKWNQIAAQCIQRIRAISKDVYILIGGYRNNSVAAVPDLLQPTDAYMVYNFHCYEPLIFTHQGAGWVDGMPADFTFSFKKFIIDKFPFK